MDYQELSKSIIENVGGSENISSVVHCATRLRFTLRDNAKADEAALKRLKGVKGVMRQGAQFQVIIGTEVAELYPVLVETAGLEAKPQVPDDDAPQKKESLGARLVNTLTSIFAPMLPAITGAGMMKAILAAVLAFGWLSTDSQTYIILNGMADATYHFLPFIAGWAAAKRFGVNPGITMAAAGLLMYPSFAELMSGSDPVAFFGLPVTKFDYTSSIIPIILIAYLQSFVEKFFYKHIPNAVKFFVAPLLTIFVDGVVGITILGPIGAWVGALVALALQWLVANANILGCFLIGLLGPFIGLTGIHQSFTPITIAMFTQFGYDPLMFPATLACNMAQCGVALAAGLRCKNTENRSMALSASLSALMGITEPALFGVTTHSRKAFASAMVAGAAGGTLAGILGLKAFAISGPGLASIAMFLGGDNPVGNLVYALVVMGVTIAISFVVAWFLAGDVLDTEEN